MPKISGSGQAPNAWSVPTLPQFVEEAKKAPAWLVKGLFLHGSIAMCSGQQKRTGKSYFAKTAAVGMAAGVPFGDWRPDRRMNVLYAEEEGPSAPTAYRWEAVCTSLGVDIKTLDNLHFAHRHGIKLDDKQWEAKILGKMRELKSDLLILDPIGYMHDADENKTQDMQKIRDCIKKVAATGATVLVIHHLSKEEDPKVDADKQVRGSGVLANMYDTHVVLRKYDADAPTIDCQIRFKDYAWRKYNFRWHFEVEPETERVLRADLTVEDPKATKEKLRRDCVSLLRVSRRYSATSLSATWGLTTKQTKLMVEDLVESGVLVRDGAAWTLRVNGVTPQAVSVSPASHGEEHVAG